MRVIYIIVNMQIIFYVWIRMNKTVFNSIEISNKLDRFDRYAVRRRHGNVNKSDIRRAQTATGVRVFTHNTAQFSEKRR